MASELRLERRDPLDEWAQSLGGSSSDAVRIEVPPPRTLINLRGNAKDQSLVGDVQRALGVELPLMPNRWHGDARMAAAWLGPDEWLLIAPDDKAAAIEDALRGARDIDPWLSVVDVSHNYSSILLSGTGVRDLLAGGCALDLRADAFSAGDCAHSIVAKSRVILRCLDERNSFELWFRPSFALYTAAWLADAIRQSA